MSRPVRFSFAGLPVSRWRNGGGETREIISCPPDAGAEPAAFAWRASIATIDRDGAFSSFPGVDRIIALLEGDGVLLDNAAGGTHALTRPGVPHAFAGEDRISARLAGGPSRDFNIMIRRQERRARVERLIGEQILPAGRDGVLYVLAGRWRLDGEAALTPGEGVWWQQLGAPLRLRPADGDGVALWADITHGELPAMRCE
ncbi:HutD family protein [Acerihabitans sp.]|uniref:HutD/Ves family protein n=1 Tax=Acerihabitans sp. TaxID=2811394 RepID=UPI002ED8B088